MKFLKKIVERLEKKAEELSWKNILIYSFAFLYLRQILETALQWNLRIGTYLLFWESVRLLLIDYPIFYINVFLILALIMYVFTGDNQEKLLKLVFLFTPLTLIPPIYDFVFQGGGMRYYYLLETPKILKSLFSDVWTQYALGFSMGQFIEIISACVLGSLYVLSKGKKLKSILIFPLPFVFIVLLGSPFYISHYILKDRTIFEQGGFLYYRMDKVLLYNVLILLFVTRFYRMNFFKLKLKLNYYIIFALFGFLTAWQKLDFRGLYFFDYLFPFLLIFLIALKRENIFSYVISILMPITFTNVPFIFLIAFYLFEKKVFPEFLRDLFLSLFAFYAGAGFLLKTRVHLAYPFYYPLFVSLLLATFNLRAGLKKFKIYISFLLIFGFLIKKQSFFDIDVSHSLTKELELKYENSGDPSYLYDLWSLYIRAGNVEKVISITKKIPFELSPADFYSKWADIYLLFENIEEAEKFTYPSYYLGNPFSLLEMGEILIKKNKIEAERLLNKALKFKISPLRALYLLTLLYSHEKDSLKLKKINWIKKRLELEF